ncbi:MAG TPA: nucleotidyltransferase family protein, partial [Mogibacterium sp.]|nr:nucleotidyltransferase family protein [Mogibacterium sp.]
KWLNILKYSVLTSSSEKIDRCPSGGEGIGNRMKAAIADASSWDDFIQIVKSKRYTYTRISRLCMQLILDIDRLRFTGSIPAYIRILGLSERGREMIAEVKKKKKNRLPIITNINREYEALGNTGRLLMDLDVRGADIYNLITGRDIKFNSDHRVTPVIR